MTFMEMQRLVWRVTSKRIRRSSASYKVHPETKLTEVPLVEHPFWTTTEGLRAEVARVVSRDVKTLRPTKFRAR